MTEPLNDATLVGVADAATRLGVSRSAVRKAIVRKRLRAVLVPGGRGGRGTYFVTLSAIDRYRRLHQGRTDG